MKTRSIFSIILVACIASAAFADGGDDGGDGGNKSKVAAGRTFTYFASDAVNQDFSHAGPVTLTSKTTVTLNPYLYIIGNLSANWVVRGWGVGNDTEVNTIRFYHADTLTLDFSRFDNPAKIKGPKTGAQSIPLQGQVQIFNDKTSGLLFDSGMVGIANLNNVFQPSGPSFNAKATGGIMRMNFGRKISITPDIGPGTYQNIGVITVIRN